MSPSEECPILWPEYLQWVCFFLLTIAALKIGSSYFIHRDPSSAVGNGLAWFTRNS